MYTIGGDTYPDILPRIFAFDLELHPDQLGATVVVSAVAPEAAVEKVFQLFPEYLREGRRGHVHEIECAEIDWETGQTFVKKRHRRALTSQHGAAARRQPEADELEGGQG